MKGALQKIIWTLVVFLLGLYFLTPTASFWAPVIYGQF